MSSTTKPPATPATPPAPQPQAGGSYTRHPATGELTLVDGTQAPEGPALHRHAHDADQADAPAAGPATTPAQET
jgi:hypothetical protein